MAEVTSGVINTKLDEICDMLASEKDQTAEVNVIASKLGMDPAQVERLGKEMQSSGIIELIYPMNIMQKPHLKLKKKLDAEKVSEPDGKMLDEYQIEVNHVISYVSIIDVNKESRPFYYIASPVLGPYTKVFMEHVRDDLARVITIQGEEISDSRRFGEVRDKFYGAALNQLSEELPSLDEEKRRTLAGILLHRMYGLGDIEMLMADDWLEEVAVNGSSEPISVYHRKFGWMKTNLRLESEEEIYNYASQIGRKAGREISLLMPILDAHLSTGDRGMPPSSRYQPPATPSP